MKKVTEMDVQRSLWNRFDTHKYRFLNIYFFGKKESDYLSFTRTGYCWEIEVKVSKSDFMADFRNKQFKHRKLESFSKGGKLVVQRTGVSRKLRRSKEEVLHEETVEKFKNLQSHHRNYGYEIMRSNISYSEPTSVANKFFYCVPEDIKDYCLERLPEYAGLMVINQWGGIDVVKQPKFIHKEKIDPTQCFDKMYYNYEHIVRTKLFKSAG